MRRIGVSLHCVGTPRNSTQAYGRRCSLISRKSLARFDASNIATTLSWNLVKSAFMKPLLL